MKNSIPELVSHSLPLNGSHLIEASAGTGKTYNIIRIYLRLLIEKKYSVEQILVMTFTVAATAEIRNRLNGYLREALLTWETSDDETIVAVRERCEVNEAKLILQQAILRLDEAAIYTIHGFCKRALSQQAFFSGMSFNANMDADSNELKLLATQDWYRNIQQQDNFELIHQRWPTPEQFIQHWGGVIDANTELTKPEPIDLAPLANQLIAQWPTEREAFAKLNKVKANSAADTVAAYSLIQQQLVTLCEQTTPLERIDISQFAIDKSFSTAKKQEQMPTAFALCSAIVRNKKILELNECLAGIEYIREHINRDKGILDQLDFNDLIIQLSRALNGEQSAPLQAALLEQFPAALVDEFQDTDPDQYAILEAIYGNQPSAFWCMIGDPKQAIYGFRGGDVFAYLAAKERADQQWTMNTNYRSSPDVINGYNQAFLQGDSSTKASNVFSFGIEYQRVNANKSTVAPNFSDNRAAVQWVNFIPEQDAPRGLKKDFQHRIAQWQANEIIQLLSDTQCDGQAIAPGDIAILVRSYGEAQLAQAYLTEAGLASVYLSSRQNIFQTEEAIALHHLLKGIWQFENDRLFIAALASSWIGFTTEQLDALQQDEHQWSSWQSQCELWRNQWQTRGLMSMLLSILQNHYQARPENNERSLTNRLHLAERLQTQSTQYRLPDALLNWFNNALNDEAGINENLLRLESDEALIKIITMHGAKGLEYPIVFLPFISYGSSRTSSKAVYNYHDRQSHQLKQAFLATDLQKKLADEEEKAELTRLLYVAMTRAKNRLYGCLAPFTSFKTSAIAQTLGMDKFTLESISTVLATGTSATVMDVFEQDLHALHWQGETQQNRQQPATFTGYIERDWWLSSFSALTRHVGHSGHSLPDRDEQEAPQPLPEDQALRFSLTKGAEAGNLLHDTLEHCDFSQPDHAEIFKKANERYSNLMKNVEALDFQQWLDEILHCPLSEHGKLAALPMQHTLRESEFYFPMCGNTVNALSQWMKKRRGSDYQLPDRHLLKGMMHGFIDLIFRIDQQYFVADYKSTHLGFRLEDYHHEAMHHSVLSSNYDLQYAIYMVALHRYLQGRIADYQPEVHLGGVYYLYLRGMHPDSPTGVFYDPFPVEDLLALDAIFAHGQAAEAQR